MYTVETSKYSFYRLYATLVTLKSHEKYTDDACGVRNIDVKGR